MFGSPTKGVPYGKIIELAGLEHSGKTLVSTVMMGLAQRDNAAAGYIDLEDSRDATWATKLGCNWSRVTKFYTQLVTQKKGPPLPLTAEEIFEQAEKAMGILAESGAQKQFWFIDSVAGIVTAKQYNVGVKERSMNSKLDRAEFLASLPPAVDRAGRELQRANHILQSNAREDRRLRPRVV